MENRPISDLLEKTMEKMRELVDANTIIGEPITTPDGVTLIPVSKVSFGFVGGGTDYEQKQSSKHGFGGGTGAGCNISPIAFLVAKGENVDLLYVKPTVLSSVDRIIETVPGVIDKFTSFMDSKEKEIVE